MLVGPKRGSRKEALGYLVSLGATHLEWIARAVTEAQPHFAMRGQEDWIRAIGYADFSWRGMPRLWASLNQLPAHAIGRIPEAKFEEKCRVGVDPPLSLGALIDQYILRSEEVMSEILSAGHPPKI